MNEFTLLITDLMNNLNNNMEFFKTNSKKNPTLSYYKLNELSNFIGSRYNLQFEIHFPVSSKIYDVENYGKENISIVIDKFRKTFPIPRETIKKEALKSFENASIMDGYMYEGKEGLKIIFSDEKKSRIEILPGSFHLWIRIDKNVEYFCNWLLENVYKDRILKSKK